MTPPSSTLPRSDFLRAPLLASARPEGYKEWHHFVVHRPGWRLLINFSLTTEEVGGRPRLVPRVIVIAQDDRWRGVVQRFDTEPEVSADLGGLTVGGNRVTVDPQGYHLKIDLPGHDVAGELLLTATGRPAVVLVNNQPLGDGRLTWLFVPRLRADGWFRVGGSRRRVEGDVAYHDHNWGRFRWGDDFGWTWASVLPATPDDPWSLVFMRMTDRRRLRTLAQALYVWHHDEPVAMFRDSALQVRSTGRLRRPADCTLPPPMRLVLAGDVADVPESVEIIGRRAGDEMRANFRPASYARVALPSEVQLDRSVMLCETGGDVRVEGSLGGEEIGFTGSGVFELLHG
jgi:hypothetical protein